MSKIKQLLIMHRDGASNRSIARLLGMDKETVNNYVNKTKALPEGLEGLLGLEDPELERGLHSGNAAYSDPRFDEFREMLPYIEGELRRKGVTLRLLWEEYRAEHPDGYGLTQFRFHYRQYAKALDGQQLLDFLEIIEDRHGRKATIIVSQLPVADWYDVLQGNTTAADAILDRIVHTAIRFELKGESMRK